MSDLLTKLSEAIERGKVNRAAAYPPDLKDQDGADEYTRQALDAGHSAMDILNDALMPGMHRVGEKFSTGKAFIPDLLIAAKAMNAAMVHLKPFFESGEAKHKGTFVLGTVKGDLHDIGKNILRMVLEGNGWKVIDLGVDVSAEKFLEAVQKNPGCHVGLSALLTTTMVNMEEIVKTIRSTKTPTQIFIGGAPVTAAFNNKIGADGYFSDPHALARHLDENLSHAD